MQCPLCQSNLDTLDDGYICPDSHGILVTGKMLHAIEQIATPEDSATPELQGNTSAITCPNDQVVMEKVDYNSTGIIIDSCRRCHYRWFDQGELDKIKHFEPSHTPEGLLELAKFAETSKHKNGPIHTESEMPLPYDIGRVLSVGDSRRTFSTLLAGGMFSIIVGMWKSKFLRILIPLLILVIAGGYWLVIRSFPR